MTDRVVAAGELWNLDCPEVVLPVVVLAAPEAAPRGWVVDVAPVWIDVEDARPWDLLLSPSDTTTGRPWRIAFGCQVLVYQRFLIQSIGELTAPAQAILHAAVDSGYIPPSRTGVPWESDDDPRLTGDDWMRALIARCAVSPDDY